MQSMFSAEVVRPTITVTSRKVLQHQEYWLATPTSENIDSEFKDIQMVISLTSVPCCAGLM